MSHRFKDLFMFAKQHRSYFELTSICPHAVPRIFPLWVTFDGEGGEGGVVGIWTRNKVSIPDCDRHNPVGSAPPAFSFQSPLPPLQPRWLHSNHTGLFAASQTCQGHFHLRAFALAVCSAITTFPPDIYMIYSEFFQASVLMLERTFLTLPDSFSCFVFSLIFFAIWNISFKCLFSCLWTPFTVTLWR